MKTYQIAFAPKNNPCELQARIWGAESPDMAREYFERDYPNHSIIKMREIPRK